MNYDRRHVEDRLASYRERTTRRNSRPSFILTRLGSVYGIATISFLLILLLVR